MDTDYVKAQLSGYRGEDRVIAVHRAWPLDEGNGVSLVGNVQESPTSNFLQACGVLDRDSMSKGSAPEYHLFAVFDGHNGDAASTFAQSSLVPVLEAYLPLPEMAEGVDGAAAWAGAVQEAMVKTVLEIDQRFAARGCSGGTTATLVLQIGQLVTCVNVGNSRAFLDTGNALIPLTREHVVETNESERDRLLLEGCSLARMDVAGAGPAMSASRERGPLRLWPGGVTLSRAIGDFTVGPAVLAVPHVVAAMLPPTGGRIVVASDGFWRASGEEAVLKARRVPLRTAGHTLLKAVAQTNHGHDVSIIVADTVPSGGTFPCVVEMVAPQSLAAEEKGASDDEATAERSKASFLKKTPSFTARQASASKKLWSMLKGGKKKGAKEGASTSASTTAQPSAHIITDCDVAALMGLTANMPGEDDPRPIWFEECVYADLQTAIDDAWRVWPIARSLALNGNPAAGRVRRTLSAMSETIVPANSSLTGTNSPLLTRSASGYLSASGAPDFQRKSILKQAASEAGSTSDDAQTSSPSSKKVSFAGEESPALRRLRRTSSEIVLPNSLNTPSASLLLGQLSMNSDTAWSDAGFSTCSSVVPQGSGRSFSNPPPALRRPPKPSGFGPEFTNLMGSSPNSRWRASYLTTAAVFTNKASARQRDRIRSS